MNYVQSKEQRNVQPRLFHGNMLKDIDLMSRGDVKQGAHFPLADHIVVVGAAGAGAGGLASGVLDQLAYFLLERHFSNQFVDSLFGAIGKTCASRGRSASFSACRSRGGCRWKEQQNEGCDCSAIRLRCHDSRRSLPGERGLETFARYIWKSISVKSTSALRSEPVQVSCPRSFKIPVTCTPAT